MINSKTIHQIRQELIIFSLFCCIPPQRTSAIGGLYYANDIKTGKGMYF